MNSPSVTKKTSANQLTYLKLALALKLIRADAVYWETLGKTKIANCISELCSILLKGFAK